MFLVCDSIHSGAANLYCDCRFLNSTTVKEKGKKRENKILGKIYWCRVWYDDYFKYFAYILFLFFFSRCVTFCASSIERKLHCTHHTERNTAKEIE